MGNTRSYEFHPWSWPWDWLLVWCNTDGTVMAKLPSTIPDVLLTDDIPRAIATWK